MKNKAIFLLIMLISSFTGLNAGTFHIQDKMYIDSDYFDVSTTGNEFYIHTGNNDWLVTHSINRDSTGMFAYESSLSKFIDGNKMEYERKWKCPYCFNYWPIGKSCGNSDCPSKYK